MTSYASVKASSGTLMKAVWYHALRASFAAEFSLETELQMVRTLDQNFMQIKTLLGANTILIRLMDQDAWCGQYGGGFSYNPAADPPQVSIEYGDGTPPFLVPTRPDFMIRRSVAQEIILSIADKCGLDVVFVIELSGYHANITDLDKYQNEVGSYSYIQQFFDPTLFYGQQTTTQLPAVGLKNSTTRSYLNDTRVAGWVLEPEWDPSPLTGQAISGHQLEVFRRYWMHFYNLVHFRDPGPNERRHFASIYVISPDQADRSQLGALIRSYKTLMFEQEAPPDVFGFAWYGNGNYDPNQIGPDIEFMVNEMGKPEPAAVSPDRIALLEGGCDQRSNPGRLLFYREAIQTVDQLGLKGIAVWEADAYENLAPDQSGGNTDPNPEFSLFITAFTPRGNTSFPTPGWTYNNRIYDNFPKYNGLPLSPQITPDFGATFFSTSWGELAYQSLTTIGEVVRDAFAATVPQPSLRAVVSAASFAGSGSISPGELVTLFGESLGPERGATFQLDAHGRVGTSLAGTRVLFNGIPAPVLYSQFAQVNAIVPYALTPPGPATVEVEYSGQRTSPLQVSVIGAEFSIFTADSSGSGHTAALNEDGTVNSASNPARLRSIITIFGTGAGQTDPSGVDGQLASDPLPKPLAQLGVVLNGGTSIEVLYAGAGPGLVAGVTQINARLPDSASFPLGAVPIVVTANGQSPPFQAVTIAVR